MDKRKQWREQEQLVVDEGPLDGATFEATFRRRVQ